MVVNSLIPAIVSCTFSSFSRTSIRFKTSPIFSNIFCTFSKISSQAQERRNIHPVKMSSVTQNNNDDPRVQRLEKNAELAENLITEIYSKLSDIEKSSRDEMSTPELRRLREENEALRSEVAKWKDLLIIREIRNGGNPVVRAPEEDGKSVQKSKSAAVLAPTPSKPAPVTVAANQKKSTTSIPNTKASKSNTNVEQKASSPAVPSAGKKEAKKGQEKKAQSAAQESNAPSSSGDEVDVSKLDMRIGQIVECERHPDADALYVEKIDLGEEKPRTIISGLVKHVPIEQMRNRFVVVLANLKPAKMRGILSEGMVMCASSPEKVEILIPPKGCVAGDLVEVEGFPRNPETVMNPKKKIFETVQPDLKTNDLKEATYKGNLWIVPGKGVIVSETLKHTMIK